MNEPLAGVALQQFLPKMDYKRAFQAIRSAHERGLLTYSTHFWSSVIVPQQTQQQQPQQQQMQPLPHTSPMPGVMLNAGGGVGGGDVPPFLALQSFIESSPKITSSLQAFTPDIRLDADIEPTMGALNRTPLSSSRESLHGMTSIEKSSRSSKDMLQSQL
ncbi:hypothetical protein BGZ94_006610, partial [Podila epigama]